MSTLEEIEAAIETLPPQDLKKLCRWMTEYEAEVWDRQIEEDVRAGKLDHLVDQAREQKRQGQCKLL